MEGTSIIEPAWNTEHKLTVVFHNTRPVELVDLTLSLMALGEQYQKFIEAEVDPEYKVGTKLLINEVKSGSISLELISEILPILPLLWQSGPFAEWIRYSAGLIGWLLDKAKDKPDKVNSHTLEQWKRIVEPVCKDGGSQINFIATEGSTQINTFNINSQEANATQNRITNLLKEAVEPLTNTFKKQIMTWHQTKFDATTKPSTGDRGIIEGISPSPVKVLFDDSRDKALMLAGDTRYDKPWQDLAYLVDVEVQTVKAVPKLYKVLKFYPDDTIDPRED